MSGPLSRAQNRGRFPRFGTLKGLDGLRARQRIEVRPFVSGKTAVGGLCSGGRYSTATAGNVAGTRPQDSSVQ